MKTFIIFLSFIFWMKTARAQEEQESFYLSTNGYFGNYFGMEAGLNLNTKKNYTVKFSTSLYLKEILFNTKEVILNYNLLFGKALNINQGGTIKLRLIGGVGISDINESRHQPRYQTGNLILNPVLEFLILPFYGLSISPVLILNKDYPMVGIGFGSMLGYLRKFPEK